VIFIPTPQLLTGCYTVVAVEVIAGLISCLLFEFWVFGLLIWRIVQFKRRKGAKLDNRGMLQLLVQDSMWWFFVISLQIILNAVFMAALPPGLTALFLPLARTCMLIFGCRLILHMRRVAMVPDSSNNPHNSNNINNNHLLLPGGAVIWQPHRAALNNKIDTSLMLHGPERAEAERINKTLNFAQRVGLPPPIQNDLVSMWYDPVMTMKRAATDSGGTGGLDGSGEGCDASDIDGHSAAFGAEMDVYVDVEAVRLSRILRREEPSTSASVHTGALGEGGRHGHHFNTAHGSYAPSSLLSGGKSVLSIGSESIADHDLFFSPMNDGPRWDELDSFATSVAGHRRS